MGLYRGPSTLTVSKAQGVIPVHYAGITADARPCRVKPTGYWAQSVFLL